MQLLCPPVLHYVVWFRLYCFEEYVDFLVYFIKMLHYTLIKKKLSNFVNIFSLFPTRF